jgi:hypothetical protein
MPSVVRRVRAQMLGQPPPPPAAAAIALWLREQEVAAAATHSLPLPAQLARPRLPPRAASSAARPDATASLPLPAAPPRPVLPPSLLDAAPEGSLGGPAPTNSPAPTTDPLAPSNPAPTTTLRPGAASSLGRQLWQRLHGQGHLGAAPQLEAEGGSTRLMAPTPTAAEGEAGEARRLLFDIQATASTGEVGLLVGWQLAEQCVWQLCGSWQMHWRVHLELWCICAVLCCAALRCGLAPATHHSSCSTAA